MDASVVGPGEKLAIIIDGRPLVHYPLGRSGFTGGTETYIRHLAHGLARNGHTVHVLTNDLEHEEHRDVTEWWWGPDVHPSKADVVMAASSLGTIGDLSAPLLVLLPNGVDPFLFERAGMIDAIACFSQTHLDLMTRIRPELKPEICHVTGLGVSLEDYAGKPCHVLGRMLWANDPARGLLPLLEIYSRVRKAIPGTSLHIAYDFDRQFAQHEWASRCMAEILWECKARIETDSSIKSLGALNHEQLVSEEMACHVHAMPSDPPNIGSQVHGMTQMELAAAGVPLVLSDIEAFPEIFGVAATILPVVGALRKRSGVDMVRVDAQDWADVVVELMRSPGKWRRLSRAGRALAEQHTWDAMVARFELMLDDLTSTHLQKTAPIEAVAV